MNVLLALLDMHKINVAAEQQNQEIIERLQEHARFLETLRVSQDGWAKVLTRVTTDHQDIVDALKARKIVAHIPTYLKNVK
jgi:hypothetical protein